MVQFNSLFFAGEFTCRYTKWTVKEAIEKLRNYRNHPTLNLEKNEKIWFSLYPNSDPIPSHQIHYALTKEDASELVSNKKAFSTYLFVVFYTIQLYLDLCWNRKTKAFERGDSLSSSSAILLTVPKVFDHATPLEKKTIGSSTASGNKPGNNPPTKKDDVRPTFYNTLWFKNRFFALLKSLSHMGLECVRKSLIEFILVETTLIDPPRSALNTSFDKDGSKSVTKSNGSPVGSQSSIDSQSSLYERLDKESLVVLIRLLKLYRQENNDSTHDPKTLHPIGSVCLCQENFDLARDLFFPYLNTIPLVQGGVSNPKSVSPPPSSSSSSSSSSVSSNSTSSTHKDSFDGIKISLSEISSRNSLCSTTQSSSSSSSSFVGNPSNVHPAKQLPNQSTNAVKLCDVKIDPSWNVIKDFRCLCAPMAGESKPPNAKQITCQNPEKPRSFKKIFLMCNNPIETERCQLKLMEFDVADWVRPPLCKHKCSCIEVKVDHPGSENHNKLAYFCPKYMDLENSCGFTQEAPEKKKRKYNAYNPSPYGSGFASKNSGFRTWGKK